MPGCFKSAMSESLIVYVSLVLCGMALSWFLLYRSIVRRLSVRHRKKYLAMRTICGSSKKQHRLAVFFSAVSLLGRTP